MHLVTERFDEGLWREGGHRATSEPTRTLELTGPGVLTDAIRALGDRDGAMMRLVHRGEGSKYFSHVGEGSWKPPDGAVSESEPRDMFGRIGLKTHERALLYVIIGVNVTFLSLLAVACRHMRRALRKKTRPRRHFFVQTE